MKYINKKSAFTLAELLIAIPVILALLSVSFATGTSLIGRLTDPHADFRVAMEVDLASEWLNSIIKRALTSNRDFTLTVGSRAPSSRLKIKWKDTNENEEWVANNISFGATLPRYNYSNRFQTLTPAVTMRVCYGDGKYDYTDWSISISGYGLVKTHLKP